MIGPGAARDLSPPTAQTPPRPSQQTALFLAHALPDEDDKACLPVVTVVAEAAVAGAAASETIRPLAQDGDLHSEQPTQTGRRRSDRIVTTELGETVALVSAPTAAVSLPHATAIVVALTVGRAALLARLAVQTSGSEHVRAVPVNVTMHMSEVREVIGQALYDEIDKMVLPRLLLRGERGA